MPPKKVVVRKSKVETKKPVEENLDLDRDMGKKTTTGLLEPPGQDPSCVSTRTISFDTGRFLVIVESPSKCKKIESYLGPNYQVIASKGHITQIDGLKSIDHKHDYHITFSPSPSKKGHIAFMRDIIRQFPPERVIIATDNDREGEAIGYHICTMFGLPLETTRRILFNEITEYALKTAVRQPTVLNLPLVQSQHARQILDLFIGFKISPVLWKYIYHSKAKSLSAGRCQTPALRLVYENYQEQLANPGGEQRYRTMGYFFSPHNLPCELKHEFEHPDEVRRFLEASRTHDHRFVLHDKIESRKEPPTPLNTSRLLQVASNLFHLSPKTTMQLAQKLYQDGHITYMRTECKKYSAAFIESATKYILGKFHGRTEYVGRVDKISNQGLQLPHEAIRVTHLGCAHLGGDDHKLKQLYHFIWKNTVQSCMSTAQYHSYKIEVSGAMNHVYMYHHEVPVFLGWKALETSEGDLAAEQSKAQGVLAFLGATKTQAVLHHAEATVVTRGLHSHYTESSLIQKLEDHGIGRPSTYALFVETIQERGYVVKRDIEGRKIQCVDFVLRAGDGGMDERTVVKTVGGEKAKLVIQPVGILCIEFLLKHFAELFEYTYTKYLEEELDGISTGADSILPWYSICEKARTDIARMIKATNQTKKEVYPLDQLHELVFLAHGPCIRRHGCENEQGIMDEDAIEFLPIKKSVEIDLEKLKRNEYCIDDLLVYKQSYLGKHQEGGVFLRTGPYGQFIEWNTTKKPLKIPEEKMATVDLVYAVGVLTGVDTVASDPKILRPLNDIMSVRKGQYGNYVFYKTAEMTKPRFVNIRKFTDNPLTCEVDVLVQWVTEQVAKPVRGGGGGGKGGGGGGGGRKWFPRKKK